MILPRSIRDWPPRFRELFSERAGIIEFEANVNKFAAESLAEIDIRKVAESEKAWAKKRENEETP